MESRRSLRNPEASRMTMRIQPHDIEVPAEDPFKHDLLGRKESVEILTHLIDSIEGPCVLAVDAAWGNGKSTFLRIWSQHLRSQNFPVVEFNAWETDFSGEPLVALSSELTEGLRTYADDSFSEMIDNTKRNAGEVLRRAVPGAVRLLTAGILDISSLMEAELGKVIASYAEDKLAAYEKGRESIETFRNNLRQVAGELFEGQGHPVVLMIDELDRCRPSYAVELLEVAKHLFSVPQIVFVIAINRTELVHSVRSLYGNEFDADGYLRRFFDIDFRLPDPERNVFIDGLLDTIRIYDYFQRTKDQGARHDAELTRNMLRGFFRAPDLSLRRIAQAIHHLGLVFASLRSEFYSFMMTALVALILRTIDPNLYHRFRDGRASDLEVADSVFGRPEAEALRHEHEGRLFEAVLIAASYEIQDQQCRNQTSANSILYQRYRNLVDTESQEPNANDSARAHAQSVVGIADEFLRRRRIGFLYSVRRIELLSNELVPGVSK